MVSVFGKTGKCRDHVATDATLRQIADEHAPASTTTRRIKPLSRWFDSDCRKSRARLDNLSVVTDDRLATLIVPLGSRR